MGMKQLEAAILNELKQVTGNGKLRQKDIMEWSTSELKPHDGETIYRLPVLSINVAVKNAPAKN